jgi:phage FluMu protein Com
MRVPAAKSGTVRKLFDFECPKCNKVWEEMANNEDLETGAIKCSECQEVGKKLISAPRVDSHAAASWRR